MTHGLRARALSVRLEQFELRDVTKLDAMAAAIGRAREDFSDMYARAREERADLLAKEILEIADAPCKDAVEVAHARNRLDPRKWLASKLAPRKYGDRVEHDHKGGLNFQPHDARTRVGKDEPRPAHSRGRGGVLAGRGGCGGHVD